MQLVSSVLKTYKYQGSEPVKYKVDQDQDPANLIQNRIWYLISISKVSMMKWFCKQLALCLQNLIYRSMQSQPYILYTRIVHEWKQIQYKDIQCFGRSSPPLEDVSSSSPSVTTTSTPTSSSSSTSCSNCKFNKRKR